MRQVSVALVNMPFGSLYRPSIGLSLLKAALERNGHHVDLHYLNLSFAERVGSRLYTDISASAPTTLLGEWVFSEALFGLDSARSQEYIEHILVPYLNQNPHGPRLPDILRARQEAEPFLQECMTEVDWERYDVIGLTSVFQQNVATLALAQKLKERYPQKLIAVGGANAEGIMGHALLHAFPFLDMVCSGEGDLAFPEFIRRLAAGDLLSGTPGITLRDDLYMFGQTSNFPVEDMDSLPYPNYDDYFGRISQCGYFKNPDEELRFLFESSRGCWWGAKSHCKFCGLNGSTMAYRSKSAERALTEIRYLYERYNQYTTKASAVDNIIDMSYFRSFLPALKNLGLNLDMFYETKANLTRDQVQTFADTGFSQVQPGIESLSTPVLRLMRKGLSGLQNIQVLKWCREFDVQPLWNYLTGFPGESGEEYQRVAQLIPLLTHLTPPVGSGQLRLDRFSPYFNESSAHGLTNVRPVASYRLVYAGIPDSLLIHMAYYFQFDYADERDVASYTHTLEQALGEWRKVEGSELLAVPLSDRTIIFDLRPMAHQPTYVLTGSSRLLYQYCDAIRSRSSVRNFLGDHGYDLSHVEVDAILTDLLADGLLVSEGEQVLSLAIPLGRYSPGPVGASRLLGFLADYRRQSGQQGTNQTVLDSTACPIAESHNGG